ncbi:MAG: phosphate acyltransferase PlsX [Terriglobales bacterium]
MPTTIAVDAMGSDRAPKPEVEGAILAARNFDVDVLLIGPEAAVRAELENHPTAHILRNLKVVHADEVIGMHDKAAQAVRTKKQSSMHVGLRLVREGRAAGFITAGNTGAAMAAAKMILGALPGVDRPALAAVFPTSAGTASLMLDVGANVDCKPHNLEQWAIMGDVYFRDIFGVHQPRVGVLSVGEEESKGNELTRAVFQLLRKLPLNFVGNVEGRDLYNGEVDVIVCDGFVGNVALKVSEGLVFTVRTLLKESLSSTVTAQVGYLLSRRAFEDFKKRLDYSEYGGAPLLGLKGVCIIGHGSSNTNAIKNAIRVAAEFANSKVNAKIERGLAVANGDLSRGCPGLRVPLVSPLLAYPGVFSPRCFISLRTPVAGTDTTPVTIPIPPHPAPPLPLRTRRKTPCHQPAFAPAAESQ